MHEELVKSLRSRIKISDDDVDIIKRKLVPKKARKRSAGRTRSPVASVTDSHAGPVAIHSEYEGRNRVEAPIGKPRQDGGIIVVCGLELPRHRLDLAHRALVGQGVVVMPGSALGAGGEGFVRIALTTSAERLTLAAQRLGACRIAEKSAV